ncbi:sensor histidine kinase [Clostridium sp. CM027]|uniref:sensor histidine kinase n=1 Tax=Clostridium sp. CM027 TaxID=2849865 RepID=UPI001C6ED71B|nr:sensor histidine kinase [Clostridium sp. CM027]MBW9145827.1 sensor histidine kinase [Clostridium sp. CM027]UVE42110.1 sensor histidine kinase [Clostridium sp. CM027]
MTINKYTKYYIFLISFIIFFLFLQTSVHAENTVQKNVLILNSYGNDSSIAAGNQSINWTGQITSAINSEFVNSKKNIDVKIQYLDSGYNFEEEYSQIVYKLFKYKFRSTKFDVVITLDDNAFEFLQKYGDTLFPKTPVVFCGVYNFNKSMINANPLFTGLSKSPDIQSTIDVGLKLHPSTKQIFIITNKNPRGIITKNLIEGLIPLYKDKVKFLFSDEENVTKLKERVKSLPKDTIIYFDSNGTTKNNKGKDISIGETVNVLFKDTFIPIYSTGYIQTNKESVGGVVTYGNDLGKEVGKLALKILNGEKVSDIPVTEDSSHRYVFNYDKLKQFTIDMKDLPKGSEIVNEPHKSYNMSKKQILYASSIVIFIIIGATIFVIININKRRRAERLLSESENLLNTLINSTTNIIYFKSAKGKFLDINNVLLTLLNIDEKDCKDKNIGELTNISTRAKYVLENWSNKDEEALKTGTVYRSEEVVQDERENINKIYDTLRIPLFSDDGTYKGLILLGFNITDFKNNQQNEKMIIELMNYDKLKTNFFSNISHELRTPLNLIFSALQVIELKNSEIKQEDKNIKKYTDIMKQNCYRLLRIIGNLIDITKIDAGHFFIQMQNNDIVNVVENIVSSIVDYVENKNISILFDTEIEERFMAFDADAMERIILNLLSNAIKFTLSGGKIEVNIYNKLNSVVISVKDTGIGIPIEKQSSIFEKFVQVDKSLSRNREGSGIGLSLVKELVVIHNGTIELESTLDNGSEFRVEIPVKLLPKDEKFNENSIYTKETKVERIKIELSDIYD